LIAATNCRYLQAKLIKNKANAPYFISSNHMLKSLFRSCQLGYLPPIENSEKDIILII
jgi:hypothetical protein